MTITGLLIGIIVVSIGIAAVFLGCAAYHSWREIHPYKKERRS